MGAENMRFNAKEYIDPMYIEEAHVLHMIDDDTQLNAANFVTFLTT